MAQMELIHWGCRGKIVQDAMQRVEGYTSYTCQTCGIVFVYDKDGLVYWQKITGEMTPNILSDNKYERHRIYDSAVERDVQLRFVDVAELAREISCEGRVM